MTGGEQGFDRNTPEGIGDPQFMRALSSLEAILLSQIEVKQRLGARLNYGLRAGIIILGIVAVSLMVLLLALSTQVNRISSIVHGMNGNFSSVAAQMSRIDRSLTAMEQRVALLDGIGRQTEAMQIGMAAITQELDTMQQTIGAIRTRVEGVGGTIGNISVAIERMNADVQRMGADMHRLGRPARAFNQMIPFP